MKRRTVSCLLSVAAVLVSVSMAVAGPIPGASQPPPLGSPVPVGALGESDLAGSPNFLASPTGADGVDSQLNVDWMVLGPGYDISWNAIKAELPDGTGTTIGALPACAGQSCYLYLYQEENTNVPGAATGTPAVPSGVKMQALALGIPGANTGIVLAAGVFGKSGLGETYGDNAADDLDCGVGNTSLACLSAGALLHPAHVITVGGVFNSADDVTGPELCNGPACQVPVPGAEEEGPCPADDAPGAMGDTAGTPGGLLPTSSFCIAPSDPISTLISGTGVGWSYDPLKPPRHETVTLFFVSPLPPVYGTASTQDSGLTWQTGNVDPDVTAQGPGTFFIGEPVPIPGQVNPIPEPTTLALFGGGLVALGLLRRRMTRSSSNPS